MRNIDEIIINKILLSILDIKNNSFLIGKEELVLTDEIYEYFEKHILKAISSDTSYFGRFATDENKVKLWCQQIIENEDNFVEIGGQMAEHMFRCINSSDKCETEKSADLAICIFEALNGKYIAILKLDYYPSYTHLIKAEGEQVDITLTTDQKGLPTPTQKISKMAIISNRENKMLLSDRDLEGWFCQNFLNSSRIMDERVNTKIIKEASENFTRKLFKDNASDAEDFRQKLTETLFNEEKFDVEDFADRSFNNENDKEEYKACLVNEGIKEKEVTIDREWAEKKLKRKRLKVDKDIELYIDNDAYNDKEKFQIKRNGDGTIDIIIKNVKNYTEK